MTIYSTFDELQRIGEILSVYARLPFTDANIPGSVMERTLALVRGAKVLPTYDFVDVVDPGKRIGWQVKATLATTPMTWKRAKLPDKVELIKRSHESRSHLQALGDAVIAFCNKNAKASLDLKLKPDKRKATGLPELVHLDDIGLARLIIHPDGMAQYYERRLLTREEPQLFDASFYEWRWTSERAEGEQLPALHGHHRATGHKHFAWHGLGEKQLHYYGEREWWPDRDKVQNTVRFSLSGKRLTYGDLKRLLATFDGKAQPEVTSSDMVEALPLPGSI